MEAIHNFFEFLTWFAAIGFLVFGLDDLFFDLQYLTFLLKDRKRPHVSLEELKFIPEKWTAIFVPAWKEGGVVNKMAEYASKVLLYEKYDIFIGVYPNDPETTQCVEKLSIICPRIHPVVLPHSGPTSKADCLNWIYQGMRLQETPGVKEYQIIALHDSEDIIHPLTLKIYNYYVPKFDMAQIPVFPLELPPTRHWIGNTYIDDFCENHTKDILARQYMGGFVPSAGVGTAFVRQALEKLSAENGGVPFALGSLTEDYEVGLRLVRAGFKAGFIDYPVDREVEVTSRDGKTKHLEMITEVVAVRENFPRTFRAAVRQRARWILGIVFQTWERTGWWGSLKQRYVLLRDRRAPVTHFINTIGYLVLAYGLFQLIVLQTPWAPYLFVRPLFDPASLLWNVIIVDTCLMIYRILQKIISVQRILGFKQAIFSIPRNFIANLINLFATLRAIRLFAEYKFMGKPLVWTKTSHIFPGQEELKEYTASIEDLLVDEGLVSRDRLAQMMEERRGSDSLPSTLLRLGFISEKQFTDVWAKHSGLVPHLIHPNKIPQELLEHFPEKQSLELQAIPVGKEDGRVLIAFREPPSTERLEQLSRHFQSPLHPVLSKPSSLQFSRNRTYPRLILAPPHSFFFYEQVEKQYSLDPKLFLEAVDRQQETGQSLSDIMVAMGLLKLEECRRLWAEYIGCPPHTGREIKPDIEIHRKIGMSFCWLHNLVPLVEQRVCTTIAPHPKLIQYLHARLGYTPHFEAELPRSVGLAAQALSEGFNTDQILFDYLVQKEILSSTQISNLNTLRSVTTDPLFQLILQLGMIPEEQLSRIFLKLCELPLVEEWKENQIRRLYPVLPPQFSNRTGCYCLDEKEGNLTFGLSRFLSPSELTQLHARFTGYPIFFEALNWEESQKLKKLTEPWNS